MPSRNSAEAPEHSDEGWLRLREDCFVSETTSKRATNNESHDRSSHPLHQMFGAMASSL